MSMEDLIYDGVRMSVPESYDDVLLGDYETYYRMKRETINERIDYVAKVLKVEASQLLAWPIDVYHHAATKLDFLNGDNPYTPSPMMEHKGVTYLIDVQEKQSFGAWIDVEEAQKSGDAVLSTVLSILCRPAGEAYDSEAAEERQKIFATLPLSKVLPVLGFFLQCSEILELNTRAYTDIGQALSLLPKSASYFLKRTGGIRLSTIWLAVRYYVLMRSLAYHLRKLYHTFNSVPINR